MDDDINAWNKTEFNAHRRKVFCLSWNCDGSRLASGSQDQTIKLWRTDDDKPGKLSVELRGHADAVCYMRWHPTNPERLASTSTQEKTVRFWDTRAAKNSATLTTVGHNLYLAWTNDGNYMVVGSREDVMSIVDVRKMKVVGKHASKNQTNELAFLAGSELLLQSTVAGEGGAVDIMRFPAMQRAGSLVGHTGQVMSVTVSPNERLVATGGADAVACVWDAEDFTVQRSYFCMDGVPRSLAFSHDSRYLAMAGEDPCVFVEDVETGRSLGAAPVRGTPEDCAWHPRRHLLAYPTDVGSSGECAIALRSRPRH